MAQKRILVIDDSALMRRKLTDILQRAGYEVQAARDGQQGVDMAAEWQPDAITLDINMPVMDGLTCLSLLMTQSPTPVVMVSSLTEEGALATFEALELGALDYVAKPGGTVSVNMDSVEQDLLKKIESALRARIRFRKAKTTRAAPIAKQESPKRVSAPVKKGIVVIGVSTGGPGTLEVVLGQLPSDFPLPIVIAQHMPAKFTQVFSNRLNKLCDINVEHVDKPVTMEAGTAYVGRGDADMVVVKRAGKLQAMSIPESEHLWHPSISRLMESVNELYDPKKVIGVMLTGMGSDGAIEMAQAHKMGARTIAESEESAVVFGMPKELIAHGGATEVLHSEEVAEQVIKWAKRL